MPSPADFQGRRPARFRTLSLHCRIDGTSNTDSPGRNSLPAHAEQPLLPPEIRRWLPESSQALQRLSGKGMRRRRIRVPVGGVAEFFQGGGNVPCPKANFPQLPPQPRIAPVGFFPLF